MPAILKCPPEILALVASHLPLQLLPASLAALALTAKEVNSYVNPILYSRVIVKNKDHASQVLHKISADADLGCWVRELHIWIDIRGEKNEERHQKTAFVKLKEVIENGSGFLPHLTYLRLVLLKSQYLDADFEDEAAELKVIAQYQLPRKFWTELRRGCPLLRGICMDGIDDSSNEPWVNEPIFYDLQDFLGLSAVTLKYSYKYPSKECSDKLCRRMINLASSLQSLTLFFDNGLQDASPLFSTTFPHLKSISIHRIDLSSSTTADAMDFWTRHPGLEGVNVFTTHDRRWFSNSIEAGFLPKLTHLRAGFADVRALASRLDQLEHLNIADSYNLQIPYLLRSVLPDGLPNLRSLEINQRPCSEGLIRKSEGAMWYETEDGDFRQERSLKRAWKSIDDPSYIPAIVSGAPNMVELSIYGLPPFMKKLNQLFPIIGQFQFLERFYCRAIATDDQTVDPGDVDEFLDGCRLLGNSCKSLRTITHVGFRTSGPYLMGKIIRGHGGFVEKVVSGRGFGMELAGDNNDPFPLVIR